MQRELNIIINDDTHTFHITNDDTLTIELGAAIDQFDIQDGIMEQMVQQELPLEVTPVIEGQNDATLNTVTAAPIPPEPVDEVDSRGIPWDARVHSSGKTTYKNNGHWVPKRGVDKALLAQVEAELLGEEPKPKGPFGAAQEAKTNQPVPPPPPPPPAVVEEDLPADLNSLYQFVLTRKRSLNDLINTIAYRASGVSDPDELEGNIEVIQAIANELK